MIWTDDDYGSTEICNMSILTSSCLQVAVKLFCSCERCKSKSKTIAWGSDWFGFGEVLFAIEIYFGDTFERDIGLTYIIVFVGASPNLEPLPHMTGPLSFQNKMA